MRVPPYEFYLLVSQLLFDRAAHIAFFAEIAKRLRSGGVLAWADLA